MTIERSVAPPHRMRIALAFAALYVIGGSTFLGQRVVVHGGFTPFLGAGLRMAIAGCLLLGWSRLQGDDALDRAPQAGVTMRQGARS